jgi:hypothetical protein
MAKTIPVLPKTNIDKSGLSFIKNHWIDKIFHCEWG